MSQTRNERRFHDALAKAFAAQSTEVRHAYFDLANFYFEKLDGQVSGYPSLDDLRQCLANRTGRPDPNKGHDPGC